MRKCSTADHYEYIATYVDDLAILMKDPQACINLLEAAPYNFKLKRSGPLNFHLGYGFHCDSTGILCMDPGKYIDWIKEAYVQHFGIKPVQKYRSSLQKGDRPELDTTLFLDIKGKEIYQSLIGSGQWNISIGRFNTQSAIMLISKYCTALKEGHLVNKYTDTFVSPDTTGFNSLLMNQITQTYQTYLTMIGIIVCMENMKRIL